MEQSMNVPKHSEMGICNRYIRRSDFSSCHVIRSSSQATNSRLIRMVHCPIVSDVNMLSTYMTLVMGDVPSKALVIKEMPKALMNRETTNSA